MNSERSGKFAGSTENKSWTCLRLSFPESSKNILIQESGCVCGSEWAWMWEWGLAIVSDLGSESGSCFTELKILFLRMVTDWVCKTLSVYNCILADYNTTRHIHTCLESCSHLTSFKQTPSTIDKEKKTPLLCHHNDRKWIRSRTAWCGRTRAARSKTLEETLWRW